MATLKNTTVNDTGFLRLPSGTTAERPGSPTAGMTRYNTSTNVIETYNGSTWINIPVRSIVTTNLVINLDAGDTSSYPGSGTAWTDLSGNGNNGTLYNGPTYSNRIVSFDGSNDYMQANIGTTALNGDPSFTVDMFVRRRTGTNIGGSAGFWGIGGTGQGNSVQGWTPIANLIHLDVYDSTRLSPDTGASISYYPEGQFVHVSWTKNGPGHETSNVKLYINGVERSLTKTRDATRTNQFNTSTNGVGVCLGRINADAANFHAPIDVGAFKVYSSALSAAQVAQNFNALRERYGL
jgi:hypothetical protein